MMTSNDNQHENDSMNDRQSIENQVNQALDASVKSMSADISDELYKRRMAALRGQQPSKKRSYKLHWLGASVSVAAACVLAVTVTLMPSQQQVPVIPQAMLAAEMPTEELPLLENLDFAIWLAEHEANNI